LLEADKKAQLANANKLSRWLWIGTTSYFAILALFVIYLARLLTSPIAALTRSVEAIRSGNFTATVPQFRYRELNDFG
jgi:nitrate/nitrite-specific signal transduction histidine kinase